MYLQQEFVYKCEVFVHSEGMMEHVNDTLNFLNEILRKILLTKSLMILLRCMLHQ